MKVISGTLKGRVIPTQKTHEYRPTLSRIREDVFNLIQHNKELNINLIAKNKKMTKTINKQDNIINVDGYFN